MKDTAISFVEAAGEKIHYTLGLISGFGGIYEGVKWLSGYRPKSGFWHYVLAVDWFVGVAVIYTVIALLVSIILTLVLSSLMSRSKVDPKRDQFATRAVAPLMIIAPIVGIIIAVINRGGPVYHDWGDIPGLILIRLTGFAALGATILIFIGGYQQAFHHKSPLK